MSVTQPLSPEYQKKLNIFLLRTSKPGEKAVIRSRRKVVQHAAAFQYMVNAFVKQDKKMTEGLIKDTHAILVKGLSTEEAGIVSGIDFAGTCRHKTVHAGAVEMTKPSDIPGAMKSMVSRLQEDLAEVEVSGQIDPFMLAAKYCDRFVNMHPFKDANGRMCRLILNAFLIKYAGIVVPLGKKSDDRADELQIAQESSKVGGYSGQLRTLVLTKASIALKKILRTLKRQSSGNVSVSILR
ncbi:MAG: hypothetical protein ASARMPRED_003409 [Alectoria sarmentosa]|nr:MAG: hypothetical protein ASARMPRED_003409 [Alectoria sarmentosa]